MILKHLMIFRKKFVCIIGYDNIKPEKKEISVIKDTNDNISEKIKKASC